MSKILKVLALALSFAIVSPQASQADWSYESGFDIDLFAQYRLDNDQSTIHFNDGFTVSIGEVLSTPQVSGVASSPQEPANYAVVVDGIVDKIVTWDGYSPNDDIDKSGLIVKLPSVGGVKYVDSEGVVRLAVITQGSVLQLRDIFDTTTYTEPLGDPVPFANTAVVTSQVVEADKSVTITVAVSTADIPITSTVTVVVVTDGRSTTSVGVATAAAAETATVAAVTETATAATQTATVATVTETATVAAVTETATVATASSSTTTTTTTTTEPVVDLTATATATAAAAATATAAATAAAAAAAAAAASTVIPVTITNLPQGENVTVKVVIHDTITNTDTTVVGPLVTTSAATIVNPDPARDAVVDKATIAGPEVVAQAAGTNGHRSAIIQVADVPNFDPNKTWATLMIVDKNGSTTAIGLSGVGQVVNVDWLSPTEEYQIKVVLRDLGTGQETTISGSRLP